MDMEFFAFVLHALAILVFVDAISTWFVQDSNAFPRNLTSPITEPLYAPIRAILRPESMGGIDISPMVLILGLNALARAIASGGLAL